jgi:hypothetical protein
MRIWHTSSHLFPIVLSSALNAGCGGSTDAGARHRDIDGMGGDATPDAGPNQPLDSGSVPDAAHPEGGDAGYVPPEKRPPFGSRDPAPCGNGTAWEQITEGIMAEQQAQLHEIVGSFVDGTKAIYDGTANAADNMGVAYGSSGRLTGQVRLLLEPTTDGHDLLILSPARDKYVRLQQLAASPGTTGIFQVHEWNVTSGGYSGTTAMVPRFASPLPELEFTVHAEGQELSPGTRFAIDVDLQATRVAPGALTFQHIVSTTRFGELADFVQRPPSNDFTRSIEDGMILASCIPPGSAFAAGECNYHVAFTLDQVVASDLSLRVDNLTITHSTLRCYHCDRYEGFSETRRCVEGERSQSYP